MSLPDLTQIEAIDQSHVQELRAQVANDSSLYNRLYSIFVEEGPELIASLRGALPSGSHSDVHDVIHKMKGSAAAMGAKRIHTLAATAVEICRSEGDLKDLSSLPEILEREYEQYAHEAKDLL